MIGILLASLGTLFDECSKLIGKKKVTERQESIFTWGFLDLFWVVLAFFAVALLVPGSFRFVAASLATFIPRLVLEVAQAHLTVKAAALAARSTFSFIRSLTIPLLLVVDVFLGYALSLSQIAGLGLIVITLLFLFANHGIEREGRGYVLFTAVNAVATISLYKYNITHFNSVVAEQLIIMLVLMAYFFVNAYYRAHENPFRFFRQPIFIAQSLGMGVAVALESFAFVFAPASIITAVKRASAILWSVLSGNLYFHEKNLLIKLGTFVVLALGIGLLIW
ncbi:hypothetical protein HYW17_04140 [Candidatus Uhrbacteria bacterium]|nr:hypothetical protein [Candidatus Uhrbacteria bacterium]